MDIHEPWLTERGHREHLSWCLEALRTFGAQEARVFTCFPPDLPDADCDEPIAALQQLGNVLLHKICVRLGISKSATVQSASAGNIANHRQL
ncbi:MAG: hypothetical protein ACKPKO_30960, partial [Candidatus Fonsibacter sp.]